MAISETVFTKHPKALRLGQQAVVKDALTTAKAMSVTQFFIFGNLDKFAHKANDLWRILQS